MLDRVDLNGAPGRPGRDADCRAEAPARDREGLRDASPSCSSWMNRPRRSAATPSTCCSTGFATCVKTGTSVIYITHRLAEVRELANRVTVLRDGKVRGTSAVSDITDAELLALIVGRELNSTFPPKHEPVAGAPVNFRLSKPRRPRASSTSTQPRSAARSSASRAWSATARASCSARSPGSNRSAATSRSRARTLAARRPSQRAAFMPADRHGEGLMMSLSVRENAAIAALKKFTQPAVRQPAKEVSAGRRIPRLARRSRRRRWMRPVSSLSGGNQQKVVIARALLSDPVLLIADEPTQGVDVGARADIYGILREASGRGIPVDRRLVGCQGARGTVRPGRRDVARPRRRDPDRRRHHRGAHRHAPRCSSTTEACRGDTAAAGRNASPASAASSRATTRPALVGPSSSSCSGRYLLGQNPAYLSTFNITNLLTAAAALGFIALGQNIALLTGGIDLSVGPLAGFLVVVGSFFINDGKSTGQVILGLVLMVVVALVVGLVNGSLIRFGRFTPDRGDAGARTSRSAASRCCSGPSRAATSAGFQDFVNTSYRPRPAVLPGHRGRHGRAGVLPAQDDAGAGGCGPSGRTRSPLAASASRSTAP